MSDPFSRTFSPSPDDRLQIREDRRDRRARDPVVKAALQTLAGVIPHLDAPAEATARLAEAGELDRRGRRVGRDHRADLAGLRSAIATARSAEDAARILRESAFGLLAASHPRGALIREIGGFAIDCRRRGFLVDVEPPPSTAGFRVVLSVPRADDDAAGGGVDAIPGRSADGRARSALAVARLNVRFRFDAEAAS